MKPILLSALLLAFGTGLSAAEAPLSQANTKIEFVCAHTGDKPDPRNGHFAKLSGTATVDEGKLTAIGVEIETNSITTPIEKLTGHLKSPDFFDVRQHPKANFKTTKIAATDKPGTVRVTGNLTLLGVTKEISFPATVSTDGGVKLNAKFDIDRTQFGMTYGEGKVENKVSLTVAIDTTK